MKITVDGVSCRYAATEALHDITFTVLEEDFVGVLGPNGSGKTTLLKTLSRTLRPYRGVVMLNDRDVYEMRNREVAKVTAVVPQETSIDFNLTALDVVLMGRNPHLTRFQTESDADYAIAQEAMQLTNTWELAHRPITELSGGEKQRVIIARALAQKPKVLLLDEPTVHLDINNQITIMDLLRDLSRHEKISTLMVLHDFNLASVYCDRVILMQQGRIYAMGPPDSTLTRENVKSVFGIEVLAKKHPVTNALYVVPFNLGKMKTESSTMRRVHVICGGGSGVGVMKLLLDAGYLVTAGVINILDSDYESAEMLGVQIVGEAPFSPITPEMHEANLEMIRHANAVVVTNTPFGLGNMKNLEAAEEALLNHKPLILIEETPIDSRDFTQGVASQHIHRLKQHGSYIARTPLEAVTFLRNMMK